MKTQDAPRMRVRFTAEIDYQLRHRGEGTSVESDPGSWADFDEEDVRAALERALRWPELTLSTGPNPDRYHRSKWSPTDTHDESCRKVDKGRVVHVDGCGCRNAVIVVDVDIDR